MDMYKRMAGFFIFDLLMPGGKWVGIVETLR